jgi:hypothetical protein
MLYDLQRSEAKIIVEALCQLQGGDATAKRARAMERAMTKLQARGKPLADLLAACRELEKHSLDPLFIQQQQADTKGFVLAARAVVRAASAYGKDGTRKASTGEALKINRKLKAGALRYLKQRIKDSKLETASKAIAGAVEETLLLRGSHRGEVSPQFAHLLKNQAHEQKIVNWLVEQVKAL